MDIYKAVDGPHGIFADEMPVDTRGSMIKRAPNDPAWFRGGLWHDNMKINVPGFWFMSWYDVSVGPNLAAYNHVRKNASPEIANQQYAVIAPTLHCAYKRATENTVVGERSMGDARLNYDELTWGWFDRFLKGESNGCWKKCRASATSPWALINGRRRNPGHQKAHSPSLSFYQVPAKQTV
jgi:predicted acyl esterase